MSEAVEIAPGVVHLAVSIANVYFVGQPGGIWTLVDTAMSNSAATIKAAAEARFGAGTRPAAIILTHGHADHSGSAKELSEAWGVPIYAHRLDLPYLTGKAVYPPPDPTVGGAMAFLCRLFPSKGMDLGAHVLELPADGGLPDMPGWEWHFTPGHSPGHVSLFRASDRTLLAGDAFATVNLDSLPDLVTKKPEISSPTRAVTCDWPAAEASVKRLAGLRPRVIGCGHGDPLYGNWVPDSLQTFADHFPIPAHGRYVPHPAVTDENGIVSLPPPAPDPLPAKLAIGVGLAALAGAMLALSRRRKVD